MRSIAAIILAAGKGKRMKSPLPKVITRTIDKPLICHVLSAIEPLHPERVSVVIGHGASVVEEVVRSAIDRGEMVVNTPSFPHQSNQLGTGDAARTALDSLAGFVGTVLILCGDTPLLSSETLRAMLETHEQEQATITILSAIVSDAGSYGRIVRDESGRYVRRITEFKDCSDLEKSIREINTGVYAVDSSFLSPALSGLTNNNKQGEYYLTDIVEQAVVEGQKVCALPVTDPHEWLGVNSYTDLQKVNEVILARRIEGLLANGINILDPRSVFIGEKVSIEPGVYIGPNTQLLGTTTLKKGCHLEGSCYLKDTSVDEDATIKFCVRAENATIGKKASVGPFAHLRAGSILGESVKVGNFVETKNAELHTKASAGHLSYLGDCVIGERSNIGAGTITCNYDGFDKHKTVVMADCFVGSDTCLVAPITVESGATIGAGSVLTQDVPQDSLALTRPPLTVRRGYVRKPKKGRS